MKLRKLSPGFTLIELLVVIVIIGILATIALPVFSRIMERGSVIQELSNLRQIGIASLAYINDNDGYLGSTDQPFISEWALILAGGDGQEGRYIQDMSVLRSPFDNRTEADDANYISFGPNNNIGNALNTERWKNTSSLVFMAPTLTAQDTWAGTKGKSGTVTKPAHTALTGSHRDGTRTSLLFADFHVEAAGIKEITPQTASASPKYRFKTDGTAE